MTRIFSLDETAVGWMKREKSEIVALKSAVSDRLVNIRTCGSKFFDTLKRDEWKRMLFNDVARVVHAEIEHRTKAILSNETKNGWFFQERTFLWGFKDLEIYATNHIYVMLDTWVELLHTGKHSQPHETASNCSFSPKYDSVSFNSSLFLHENFNSKSSCFSPLFSRLLTLELWLTTSVFSTLIFVN